MIMTTSSHRAVICVIAGLLSAPVEQVLPLQAVADPGALFAPAVAFDETRQRLIVFGGEGNNRSLPTQTWEWNGSAWSSRSVAGPSGRFWSAMTYDASRARTVLFGGAGANGALGDTWEFDGEVWTRVSTGGPSPRFAHEMAYDRVRRRVVMHGGTGPGGPFGDVWEWDGSQWQQRQGNGPSSRFAHAMTFDEARQQIVVFGGHGPTPRDTNMSPLGDTWTLGAAWANVTTEGPGTRDHTSMVYDRNRRRVVLFGGVRNPGPGQLSDTWEWDGTRWSLVASDGPIVHGNHRLVYDPRSRTVLLFTGSADGATTSRVHQWNGTAWRSAQP